MEAARQLSSLRPLRRAEHSARELEQLRPLGEAFLVRRFGGSINRADAEDAVAEVVIRLHQKIESGQPPRNLRAAFFTSVRNAAIDQLRSRGARPTTALESIADAPAEGATPSERVLAREDTIRLQEALGRMRANYREALVLRFGLGLTVPEIAERLKISLPAAKKLVLRSTEQARRRLQAIEGAEFCPDAQAYARRSLVDRELGGLASESERQLLRNHLSHCGRCKTFLAELRHGLHELGGTALLAGEGVGLGHHLGHLEPAIGWIRGLANLAHGASARVRLTAFRAGGALQGADPSGAGLLNGGAQKALAICGAGAATTATCLATGVIGPGLGAGATPASPQGSHASPPPIVRAVSQTPSSPSSEAPPPAPEPSPAPASPSEPSTPAKAQPDPSAEPSAAPSSQPAEEFGFENSAPPSESAPTPEPAAAGAASRPSSQPVVGCRAASGRLRWLDGSAKFGFGG